MLRLFLGILLLAALSGCSSNSEGDRDAVSEVMGIRSRALNDRDVTMYISILSADYNYMGKDFSRLKNSLVNNFQAFEGLSYQAGDQTISLSGKHAEVVGTYRMKVVVRGTESVLDGKERIKLVKESGGWKIIAGL